MADSPIVERDLTQPMAALDKANKIRIYRSALKKDLKAGRANIFNLLTDPPEMILTMTVFALLMSLPQNGQAITNRMLAKCQISPSKTVGEMTERQRDNLLALLRKKTWAA